jgi:hypothetical protein
MRARVITKHIRTRWELIRDIRWGVGWGLWLATGFSVIALALAGLRGSTKYPEIGISTWGAIAIYYGLSLIGGSAVGLLRPFTRSKLGGFAVGWFIGFLVYGSIGIIIEGVTPLTAFVALILGLSVGGTAGYQTVSGRKSKRDAA